jgi:hypothetical protein
MVVPHDHRYARVSGHWLPNERPRPRTVPAFHRSDYYLCRHGLFSLVLSASIPYAVAFKF